MHSPQTQTSTSFGPQTETSRITEYKDDPEEEISQSNEEILEKLWNTFQQQFGKLHDAEG